MPTTTFRTVNGRILGHNKAGVASEYLLDPLGSVIGTSTSAGVVSNRTTYWPYGEVRTGGVSSVTPFGFCGGWGYYTDSSGSLYVRARYYRPTLTRWQTVDPLWPEESPFGYVRGRPTHVNDASGLGIDIDKSCNPQDAERIRRRYERIQPLLCPGGDPENPDGFADCVTDRCNPFNGGQSPGRCLCKISNNTQMVRIKCDYNCKKNRCGTTDWGKRPPEITICFPASYAPPCGPLHCVIAHELIHACRVKGTAANQAAWDDCMKGLPGCEKHTNSHDH
jgi:RHS repeat-associated protein